MSKILGKDRDVEDTISLVKGILKRCNINVEESNLLNPVENIWSVHLKDSDSNLYTNGKGSTKLACLASAYCEFLERLATGFFFYDYKLDGFNNNNYLFAEDEILVENSKAFKKNILNKKLWKFYDSDNKLQFENFICSNNITDRVLALPFKSLLDGEKVLFPLELIKNLYSSNGLSCGNTEDETLIQGISESIERGVKNYIISEGISLPDISEDYLKENNFFNTVKEIESYGFKLLVKDASLGGRFPVICVLLINQKTGEALSSFGAHPIPNVAIDRTLTELLQGRKIEAINCFSSVSINIDKCRDEANLESHFINSTGDLFINLFNKSDDDFTLWDYDKSGDNLEFLLNILKGEGYNCYTRTKEIDGMWVSQTIVPQLSEIYPTDDLELEFKNSMKPLLLFMTGDSSKENLDNLVEWFELSYIDGNNSLYDYLGLFLDQEMKIPNYKSYEAELLVLILTKNYNKAISIIEYDFDLSEIPEKRAAFWTCVKYKLFDVPNDTINTLFNMEIVDLSDRLFSGVIPEELFPSYGANFLDIEAHSNLKSLYLKYKNL